MNEETPFGVPVGGSQEGENQGNNNTAETTNQPAPGQIQQLGKKVAKEVAKKYLLPIAAVIGLILLIVVVIIVLGKLNTNPRPQTQLVNVENPTDQAEVKLFAALADPNISQEKREEIKKTLQEIANAYFSDDSDNNNDRIDAGKIPKDQTPLSEILAKTKTALDGLKPDLKESKRKELENQYLQNLAKLRDYAKQYPKAK